MKKLFLFAALAIIAVGCADKPDHAGLYQEVKSVDKLMLASMSITKTARLENSDWYKVGKRVAVYSYDSYIRAYIDLSELNPEDLDFDDASRTVKLTLPPLMTEISGRDMEMRKVYDDIGFFRDSIDSRERAAIKEVANNSFKKEVADNPAFRNSLEKAAQKKARTYFEEMFGARGWKVEIDFRKS